MKLLIIAQPKSASTSLMKGIEEVTGLSSEQTFYSKNSKSGVVIRSVNKLLRFFGASVELKKRTKPLSLHQEFPSVDYWAMSLLHSDIADFTSLDSLNHFMIKDVYKQHFPPTISNLRHLKGIPKVLLIRDIKATLEAYTRVNNLDVYRKCLLENSAFLRRLEYELNMWQSGWLDIAKKDKSILIIDKEELVKHSPVVLQRIISFASLPSTSFPDSYELPRERYQPR